MLIVGNTKLKGRGVFAQKRFIKGEVIERAPVVVIPAEQVELIDEQFWLIITTIGKIKLRR